MSHVHAAPDGCVIDDESAWRAANPALGVVKSLAYMRAEVLRVRGVPSDEPSFRAYDLNLAIAPTREMVCTPVRFSGVLSLTRRPMTGRCLLDSTLGRRRAGRRRSRTGLTTGALRTWLAFGDVPDLAARGRRDGADYLAMARRGELRTYPGRTVPIAEFVVQVKTDLGGADVRTAVADGYKASELLDVCPWPLEVVRSGVGPSGSAAVRAFQRAVLTRTLATVKNYSLTNAIAESTVRRDGNGNPALDQARSGGRIDGLSAAVLAVGEAARCPAPVPLVVYTLAPVGASA